ncbi:MAG: DnaA ATPase domain-containing protein [Rickettsiales bacterium]
MQLAMPFAPQTSYHAADFIPGDANAQALALVERWPDWPYSIVLLHGPAGSGKTHLAHVFAERARAHMLSPARVGAAPADQLLTGNHSWVLDGIEQVSDEAALAQLINHARARGDYLLLTATTSASQLPLTLPDLSSRLKALPSVALTTPDEALLAGVMAKSFSDRQLRIPPDLMDYAINRMERSFEAVQQFATAVDALSLARGRAITQALVREALGHG